MKMKSLIVPVLALVALSMTALFFAGCSTPPVASRLQIGNDFADLPKNDAFESARYVYTNAMTGERRELEIKNAHADPAANLKAFTDVQTANLRVLETAVNKIAVPGITTTAPAAPPSTPPPVTPPK